ncbi:unnamed protein product [Leptosia nina]|uniref:UDP-glycosyltransferases domain-containing protein n=1 Tax=Leptosia nina TaxID=320188 RepID=A0AAV1JA43_9NEOP
MSLSTLPTRNKNVVNVWINLKTMANKLLLLVLIVHAMPLNALRLLVFFPISAKSHSILGHGIVNHLLDAGHEVVHITSFPKDKPLPNLTEIDVSEVGERIKATLIKSEEYALKHLAEKRVDPIFLMGFSYTLHKQVLEEPIIREFLGDKKQKFDGVVVEWFFSNFVAGLAPLFQAPLIWVATTEAHWQVLEVIDEPSNPAYSIDLFSSNSLPLDFIQRIEELYTMVKRYILARYYITPKDEDAYNTLILPIAERRGEQMPEYEEAIYNASLLLLNSHPSYGTPFKLPQNAKYVGGYHVSTEVKPLPKDLQNLMDEARHGVIYFSMGSNLKSADMSESMKSSLLKMFAQLDETVIWKFETDLNDVPKNVHLVGWAPQESILAHPNLKFFITHGGQLSTTEAIHFGVPVIGIPVLGDQHANMNSVKSKGFGITVQLTEQYLVKDLYEAIKEIKSNPRYKEKARELSRIYHKRQQPPGKELVFWIEYVISTGGATHLRSPGLVLPLYKKLYLDVIVFTLLALYFLTRKIKTAMLNKTYLRWLILIAFVPSNALRLLVFFPLPSKSHSILGHGIVDNLLHAGHEVVHITAFPKKQEYRHTNRLKEIDVSVIGQRLKDLRLNDNGYTIRELIINKIDPIFIMSFVNEAHKAVLETEDVKELFEDPKEQFDGVIVEWCYSNYVAGIASLFQSPLIWFTTTDAYWQILELIDEVPNPALHVDMYSLNSPPLNFYQRIEELFGIVKRYILASYYVTPTEKSMYESLFSAFASKRGVHFPPYEEAIYNGSFLLINSHPSIGFPRKLPQNAKHVAGFHISSDVPALPENLQKVMDSAEHGVIYFSMGSNLRSEDMSERMKSSLMILFAKLNETVIWKFETDLDKIPKNVHLVKWAPQESILAHPNLKLFITHGGQLSTIEAIHFGVPIIGIPVMGDQLMNMNIVSQKGFGMTVDLSEDTLTTSLFSAIKEMSVTPRYKIKAKELSVIFHNRQQTPGEELVYWIEYVINTGGAPHLRSPALSLPLYKKMYLDLIALILTLLFLLVKIKNGVKCVIRVKKISRKKLN